MSGKDVALYDQFASEARSYGVELTEASPGAVADAIADAIEPPAIGTPLPWDDVELPDCVETNPTPADVEGAVTGVTGASLAIADYGSVVLEMTAAGSEPVSLFNDLHVAVLRESDLVPDMAAAFEWFGERARESRGSAIVATGPSATADMGALVQGAHGPEAVEVIVVS
ncbi:LUD domain-containing protein [Halorubellus salinus]|uniref:LUD domain-containing protein n=1 Tax=Halorubellus salinus TaxID=755309 RepID=UPI001D062CEC|nr:LUD domain-containing protein [Halorubellus salinus]